MSNLLDKASIILTPTAYNNGEALCVKPSDGSGDFDFSRNSAATRVNAQGLVENVQILSSNLVQNGDFSEEGAEEVSNGSFSQEGVQQISNGSFDTDTKWTTNTGWSISGGSANCDGTQSGNTTLVQQNGIKGAIIDFVVGKTYKVNFDVVVTSGVITQLEVASGIDGNDITTSGNHTTYITAVSTNDRFTVTANPDFVGSIDNVSVREVGQDWELQNGWSIGNDVAVFIGTVSAYRTIYQQSILTIGKTYKLTFDIVSISSGSIENISQSNPTSYNTQGTITEYFTASNIDLFLKPTTDADCSITNISVKEVGMDWTLETGWSIGDDVATCDGTNAVAIQQPLATVNTKLKKITFTVSNYVSGTVRVYSGSGADILYEVSENGTFTYYDYLVFNKIFIYSSSSFTGSITNISVIEITTDTNLPRINYEGFSYQDALGSELVLNGDFATDSDWNLGTGWSIEDNKLIHTGGGSYAQQGSLTAGTEYKVVIDVTEASGSGFPQIYMGGLTTAMTAPDIYTFYITAQSGDTIRVRGLNDCKINSISVKEYSGQEVVPDSGCGHWLWEPQTTQLLPYSEDFSQWAASGDTTIESGYLAPDGTNNAYKVSGTSSALSLPSGLTATTTRSIYARTVSGTGQANLCTFNSNTNNLFTITEQWQRFDVNSAISTGATSFYAVDFRGSTTLTEIILWGANATNDQDYATSYIPSNGSTVTRNQDVCNNGGSLASINSTEGVLYAEIARTEEQSIYRLLGLDDDTATNYIKIGFSNTNGNFWIRGVLNGTTFISSDSLISNNANQYYKIALKWKSGDSSLYIDGTNVLSSSTLFSNGSLNQIDFRHYTNTLNFFGKTKALVVYKEALSDEELIELTTI